VIPAKIQPGGKAILANIKEIIDHKIEFLYQQDGQQMFICCERCQTIAVEAEQIESTPLTRLPPRSGFCGVDKQGTFGPHWVRERNSQKPD
jgi:hypothetical protein